MHVGSMDLIEAGVMGAPIVSVIDFPAAVAFLGIQVFLSTEQAMVSTPSATITNVFSW